MKKITIALLLMALTAVVIAEVATKKSPVDILIERVMGTYEKSVKDADDYYGKYAAPIQKRRDGKIIAAGDMAIKKLTAARRSVSEIDGIKLEQQIAVVRKSLDEKVGDIPTVTRKAPVLALCGVKYKGHTYLTIASNANWKEAVVLCKKMGGHLVYMETEEERVFLAKTFPGTLWVGATDAHKEGDWRWGNGKPVAKYLWCKGQPQNARGEDYGILHPSKGRMLHDAVLSWPVVGFICEWE
jgi:hypothetical protein